MTRDLRKYMRDTNIQIAVGAVLLLFIVGLGLIWRIYGFGAAVSGLLCILGMFLPIGLVFGIIFGMDWIVKRANSDDIGND